jgi:hypothetical protein
MRFMRIAIGAPIDRFHAAALGSLAYDDVAPAFQFNPLA